jgi:hypothetical protein
MKTTEVTIRLVFNTEDREEGLGLAEELLNDGWPDDEDEEGCDFWDRMVYEWSIHSPTKQDQAFMKDLFEPATGHPHTKLTQLFTKET